MTLSHYLQQRTSWQEGSHWWTSLISHPRHGEIFFSYYFIHSELLLIGSTPFQCCPNSAKSSFNVLGLKSHKNNRLYKCDRRQCVMSYRFRKRTVALQQLKKNLIRIWFDPKRFLVRLIVPFFFGVQSLTVSFTSEWRHHWIMFGAVFLHCFLDHKSISWYFQKSRPIWLKNYKPKLFARLSFW